MTILRQTLVLIGLTGCGPSTLSLTATPSRLPRPAANAFRAGFGRIDITPPPGVGLAGNGPEGAKAMGYRTRLYARAVVFEDRDGNRLALVVADLPLGSALLHRRVAEFTNDETTRIGVDRLLISVTHTHSGPGHHFEGGAYNEEGSAVPGYDPVMVDSLARRIERAIRTAVADLRPARVGWGKRSIFGLTRIRSLAAIRRNVPAPTDAGPEAAGLPFPEYRLVDPDFSMLRIDQLDSTTMTFKPVGAFSIFSMHGTGNSPANDLFDTDIQGIVARSLERHIDVTLNGNPRRYSPRAFHLLANGNSGDISPAWPPQSRCATPEFSPFPLLEGPFEASLWQWKPRRAEYLAECVQAGRKAVEDIGQRLGEEAIQLFDSLGANLVDEVPLARAFTTIPLRDSARQLGICPEPALGMTTFGGADDSRTRLSGWRLFGVVELGLEQSPNAPNLDAKGCHAPKRKLLDILLGGLPNKLVAAPKLPAYAQVSVFRIGDRLLGALPVEVTATAGRRMRARMTEAAGGPARGNQALLVTLTNGYLEYVTTAEEYGAQYYEGASTIYGPGEAEMFGRTLARLVTELSGNDTVAASKTMTIKAKPGRRARILEPRASSTDDARTPSAGVPRCSADTLYLEFEMGSIGAWPMSRDSEAGEPRVTIFRDGEIETWDDDPRVEIRIRSSRGRTARWELKHQISKAGKYSIRLRGGAPTQSVACAGG